MNRIHVFNTALVGLAAAAWIGASVTPASAGEPSAIVEDITSKDGDALLMAYLEPGRQLTLAPGETAVLGYLRSCIRETISGGTVTIGENRSTVTGGEVARERVECDGGKVQLTKEQASKSAVAVFRTVPKKPGGSTLPEPAVTIYGASPVLTQMAAGAAEVVIERLDKPTPPARVPLSGRFYDTAKMKLALAPGGLYRATAGDRQVIFKVDPLAAPGAGPVVGRLIRL
jgi:hypothetical protein